MERLAKDLGLHLDRMRNQLGHLTPATDVHTPESSLDRAGLRDTIYEADGKQDTVRNKRLRTTNAFQKLDEQVNQLDNLLHRVIKALYEMRKPGPAADSGL